MIDITVNTRSNRGTVPTLCISLVSTVLLLMNFERAYL